MKLSTKQVRVFTGPGLVPKFEHNSIISYYLFKKLNRYDEEYLLFKFIEYHRSKETYKFNKMVIHFHNMKKIDFDRKKNN